MDTSSDQNKTATTKQPKYIINLQIQDRLIIGHKLKDMYSESVLGEITYTKLHDALRTHEKDLTPNLSLFIHQLSAIGYQRVKTMQGPTIIMENPKITFERVRYLQKIQKARSLGKNILYLDERTFNAEDGGMVPFKGRVDSVFDEMILYYAITKDGYDNGVFCFDKDFNSDRVNSRLKWIMHILLPSLQPSSVIVINNGSFLTTQKTKQISRYDPKKYMVSWLKNNNVSCTPNMHKADLYELIQKCDIKPEDKSIDYIFKIHGHEVLRLPDTISGLNPTNELWREVNDDIRQNFPNTHHDNFLIDLKQYINKRIQSIKKDKWDGYENLIKTYESSYFYLDMDMEPILDKILIDTQSLLDATEHKISDDLSELPPTFDIILDED